MDLQLKKPRGVRQWLQLWRLYLEAFPAAERKPITMILQKSRQGKTDIWCLDRGGKFMGLGITINGPQLVLLDYFAVQKDCRGQGVGAKALDLLQRQYSDRGFFLEIESTLEPAPNAQQRARRKRFYLSCGMQELGTTAKLFGVNMELLGVRCRLDYDGYRQFYAENYSQWAADHIGPV